MSTLARRCFVTARMELYHYWRSSCSWRVRWALNHKGLAYMSHTVNLLTGEQRSPNYLKLNPAGTLPTLVVNGTAYADSVAILEWLEEKYPHQPLLPTSPDDRAVVRRLVQTVVSGIFPLQNMG